jgi:hypothetical protein
MSHEFAHLGQAIWAFVGFFATLFWESGRRRLIHRKKIKRAP